MSKRDYYDVLGVAKDAQRSAAQERVPQARHAVSPGQEPGDKDSEAKFKEINEAYQVLADGEKRAAYDRFGHAAFQQGGGGGGPGGPGFDGNFGDFMSDIFDTFFGENGRRGAAGARGPNGAQRGADLRYNLEVSLEEAFNGKPATIKVPSSIACEPCKGSGAAPGSQPKRCATCGGAGRVRASQGFFSIERTCPTCAGQGETIDNPCKHCQGSGRVTRERQLSVNIPAGVEDGTRIRLAGEGEAGTRGGPQGDLYIFVAVKPHAIFQRDGADLFCRVPLPFVTAALGGEIEAQSRWRQVQGHGAGGHADRQAVPPARQGHAGIAPARVGDLYIQVVLETPQALPQAPARIAAGIREGKFRCDQSGGRRLLFAREGFPWWLTP